jgi:MFS family permease
VISQNYLDTLDLHGPENTNILAIITSIYDIGCFFGALVAFTLGEKIGRKWSIMVGTTTMAVGAILQISAFSRPHMIVGRIVAGMGNGINTATVRGPNSTFLCFLTE